eukprot:s1291_g3.t1
MLQILGVSLTGHEATHFATGSDVIFSFFFFCLVVLQLRLKPCERCQSWFVVHHERLRHDTDTEEDAASHTCKSSSKVWCACNFCGVSMAVLLCISFLSQIIGWFIYASSPIPSLSDSEPYLAYWCLGEPNSSIVVLEPGFMASSGSLLLVQESMARATRVCIYDPLGMGLSQGKMANHMGFKLDAWAMHSVLSSELRHYGQLPSTSWQIVVGGPKNNMAERSQQAAFSVVVNGIQKDMGGHSRGHLTACRFKVDYGELYSNLLVLGFDGSWCNQRGASGDILDTMATAYAVMRFTVCPLFSMLTGLVRLVVALFGETLMRAMLPEAQVPGYSPAAFRRLAEPYYWPRLWRSSADRGRHWLQSYDGPTQQQCHDAMLIPYWAQGGGGGLGLTTAQEGGDAALALGEQICINNGRDCAEHLSMISSSWFAKIASQRALDFLELQKTVSEVVLPDFEQLEDGYPSMKKGTTPTGTTPWLKRLSKANPEATGRLVIFSWTGNRGGQGSAHNFQRAPGRWSEMLKDWEQFEVPGC